MTEHEWTHETDPGRLLKYLKTSAGISERKLRLFALACCRHSPGGLADDRSREAVLLAERFLDDPPRSGPPLPTTWDIAALTATLFSTSEPGQTASSEQGLHTTADLRAARVQADLLRCIVGNPLRRVAFDPAWHTSAVVKLATAIYREHAFQRMALLGDALARIGCEDTQILAHCRSAGRHTRGCWVVDLVLGHA